MRIIKSLNDIFQLEKEQIISALCSQMLQNNFKEKAREAIFPEETPDPSLEIEENGYIVLLEASDNPKDWAC